MNQNLRDLLRPSKRYLLRVKPLRPLWVALGYKVPPERKATSPTAKRNVETAIVVPGFESFDLVGANWTDGTGKPVAVLWGFHPWKRAFICRYLGEYRLAFARGNTAWPRMKAALDQHEALTFVVWGMSERVEVGTYAAQRGIPLYRMEDGFIRSAELGSRHTLPLSLVLDKRGIYFDASKPSDLECLLNEHDFSASPEQLSAAAGLLKLMRSLNVSKYSLASLQSAHQILGPRINHRILVIGQVEADASIRHGLGEGWTNLRLIEMAKKENPDAEIIYRPHPDVAQGFRASAHSTETLAKLCRVLTEDVMLGDLFRAVDHVYTLTSLSGFEALIHGLPVTVVGAPFYAGWGLTDDRLPIERRTRKLSIEQLFCAAYLLYPRYLGDLEDPVRGCLAAVAAITAQRRVELDKMVTSETILKSPEVIMASEYWPALFRPPHWPDIKKIYGKKLPAAMGLLQAFAESGGDHFQRSVAYLLVGQMRDVGILGPLLMQLRTCIKLEHTAALLQDLSAYGQQPLIAEHLAWLWEQTGDQVRARVALEHLAWGSKFEPQADAALPIAKEKRAATVKLAQFELRQRRLDAAARLFNRVLLSGVVTGDILSGLAEIARLQFDFRSSAALLQFFNRFDPTWKAGRTHMLEAKSAALTPDGAQVFDSLATACRLNPQSSEGVINVEEALIQAFGNLPYMDAFLAATETRDADAPIAHARALIAAKSPARAEQVLLGYAPRASQLQQYYYALSWAYSYQGKLDASKRLVEGVLQRYPSVMLYREALRIAVLANDYGWAQEVLDDANARGVDVGDMYFRKIALGRREIGAGYQSFRRIPFTRIIRAYLGDKYTQILSAGDKGRRVLIAAFFGPGDEIRFASKYRQMHRACGDSEVTFTADTRLAPLLQRSYPELTFAPVSRIRSLTWLADHSAYTKLPGSDLHTVFDNQGWALACAADQVLLTTDALGDVIGGYETFDGTAYLRADAGAVSTWRERLRPWSGGPLVGLSWRSGLATYARDEHYLRVQDLEMVLESTDLQFINLQYDDCADELAYLEKRYPGRVINFPDLDQYNDLEGVAALMSCLDLIVAPATTVVELAGALGRPTVLLSNSSELHWRKRPGTAVDVWHRSVTHVEGDRMGDKQSLVEALVVTLQRHPAVVEGISTAPRHNFWRGVAA